MAAKVGVAKDEAQALKDQKTLMPAVKEAVAAGAGRALLEHTTNPSVAADLARGYAKRKTTRSALAKRTKPRQTPNGTGEPAQPANVEAKAAPARHSRAHTAACCGDAWTIQEWETWGRNNRLDLRTRERLVLAGSHPRRGQLGGSQ
jgi:hypothetical protein